jgi:hypothetical protein
VPSTGVVEALDIIEDGKSCFARVLEAMPNEQFPLEGCVEALAHRIIVAIADLV